MTHTELLQHLNPYYLPLAYLIATTTTLAITLWGANTTLHKLSQLLHRKKPHNKRDPRRLYTSATRRKAARMCSNRCEGGTLTRCRNKGHLHGDHWYPHSRGGQTSWDNLVMLCPTCNRKKSDHIPTPLQTLALRHRRKKAKGYTAPMPHTVGKWM